MDRGCGRGRGRGSGRVREDPDAAADWGKRRRILRSVSPFLGRETPPPYQPGDAPHQSCLQCHIKKVWDENEDLRCEIHRGSDMPWSEERKVREMFKTLLKKGLIAPQLRDGVALDPPCFECWNGGVRKNQPNFQCKDHPDMETRKKREGYRRAVENFCAGNVAMHVRELHDGAVTRSQIQKMNVHDRIRMRIEKEGPFAEKDEDMELEKEEPFQRPDQKVRQSQHWQHDRCGWWSQLRE